MHVVTKSQTWLSNQTTICEKDQGQVKWTGATGHRGERWHSQDAMVGQGKRCMHLISRKGLDKTEKAFRSHNLAEEKNCAWQRSLQRIFKMFHCTSRLFSALWHFSRDGVKIWIAFICVFLPGCYFSHVIFCRPRSQDDHKISSFLYKRHIPNPLSKASTGLCPWNVINK